MMSEKAAGAAPFLPVKREPVGGLGPARELTEAALESWYRFIDAGSPRTLETYKKALRRFYRYMVSRGTSAPDRDFVLDYKEALRATCKPATVQVNLVALKLFFRWAAQEGIYDNIADHVKGVKTDRGHKKDYLTGAQAGEVLSGIDKTTPTGLRDFAAVALMLTTGLRVSSVVNANIGDLRPAGDSLVLYYKGKGHVGADTFVKIPAKVEKALRAYLATRGRLTSDSPLFAGASNNGRGTRLTARSLSRLIKGRLVDAGFNSDRLTAHSLRHTAATLNLLNGGTIQETQQLLDHANINTTMIYAHALDRAASKSEARIAAAISF